MPTTEEINKALQDALAMCYASSNPLDTLAEEIGKLGANHGWSRADLQQITQKALRMLSIMMEPRVQEPESDQPAKPLKLYDEPNEEHRRSG